MREKGLTLVPTKLYFKDGRVKVEIAVARGKERIDKRRDLADRDAKRQMERESSRGARRHALPEARIASRSQASGPRTVIEPGSTT